jgi:hypothetical protein
MTDLSKFIEDCSTVRSFFEKVKANDLRVHPVKLNTGREGLEMLAVKADYVLVQQPGDSFDESVRPMVAIHPYGASIGYTLENPDF